MANLAGRLIPKKKPWKAPILDSVCIKSLRPKKLLNRKPELMDYWHAYTQPLMLREVARWYPKTYEVAGQAIAKAGLLASQNGGDRKAAHRELLAIIAAIPGHVQPYKRSTGNGTPWAALDFSPWLDHYG